MSERRPWLHGALVAAPLVPGIASVGVLYGASAVDAGMPPWSVITTSFLVATGTAQFVALDLLHRQTAWWTVVLVGVLINLRFAAYAMHLGGIADRWPTWRRWTYYGLVTDEGYALTAARRQDENDDRPGLLGWSAALMLLVWSAWLIGSSIGAMGGTVLATQEFGFALDLDLAVPLTLLSVLVLMTTSYRHARVAVAAGATALVLRHLPMSLGLLAAIFVGIAVGQAGHRSRPRKEGG